MARLTIVEDDSYLKDVTDPVLKATVYFGRVNTGLEGKGICEIISQVNSGQTELYMLDEDPWEFVNRPITKEAFDILLRYYENNQQYYFDHDDWDELLKLEMWFLQVVEPKPEHRCDHDDWFEREKTKLKGYTWYSLHPVRSKLKIPGYIMKQVHQNNIQIS